MQELEIRIERLRDELALAVVRLENATPDERVRHRERAEMARMFLQLGILQARLAQAEERGAETTGAVCNDFSTRR